jgi:aminopeptidase
MHSKLLVEFLKEKRLFSKVNDNFEYLKQILVDTLKIRKRDEYLIIGDLGLPGSRCSILLAGCYLLAAKRLGLNYKLILQNPKNIKETANARTITALRNLSDESFLSLSLSGKLGTLKALGKSFRRFIKDNRHNFTSTMKLSELPTAKFKYLIDAINVDYVQMRKNADRIQKALTLGHKVNLTTEKGTNLEIGIRGMRAISNDARYLSKSGNIPAGEVYIPPRSNHVNGRIIIDGSLKTIDSTFILNKEAIALDVRNGKVIRITGTTKYVQLLEESLKNAEDKSKYPYGVRRIGELGIGINPKAKIIGPTIINEKVLGTAHIALGSNAWFGGNVFSIIHLDQVFKNPKIWVDGRRLI